MRKDESPAEAKLCGCRWMQVDAGRETDIGANRIAKARQAGVSLPPRSCMDTNQFFVDTPTCSPPSERVDQQHATAMWSFQSFDAPQQLFACC